MIGLCSSNQYIRILRIVLFLCAALYLGFGLSGCAILPSSNQAPVESTHVAPPITEPTIMDPVEPMGPTITEPTMDPQSTTVVLDIWLGVPNPTWGLTAAETMTLTALLDALPASEQSVDPLPARMSGYQSFTVHLPDRSVQVYRGVVREQSDRGMRYFTDSGQRVERWLYVTAQPHLAPNLYQQLDTMITEAAQRCTKGRVFGIPVSCAERWPWASTLDQ